jgi:hypothetical protein
MRKPNRWVETTDAGRKLWDYSSEDLNIGDLANEEDEDLNRLLVKEGIASWKVIYSLGADEEFSYDRVLAKPALSLAQLEAQLDD